MPSSSFCSRSPYVHLYKFKLTCRNTPHLEASRMLYYPLFSLSSAVGPTALSRSISKSEDSFGCSLVAKPFSIRSDSRVHDICHIRAHPATQLVVLCTVCAASARNGMFPSPRSMNHPQINDWNLDSLHNPVLLRVMYGLNTIFCEREEQGLVRQPGIKKPNLNNTLKRAMMGIFVKLLRRGTEKAEFSSKSRHLLDIYQKKRALDRLWELFYSFVALHDGWLAT